ncbi:class I SAM-dependent methyltransferase [Phenylobacterium sp. J426]|uniref:class I SAM-dependent methyltransferase n=1 Tax=Phenylobacterium sp. J426 TaxID=2898439 RepID=UPI002150C602|nr:class I SAM-dependent methyltransferase [Phenylobacterium sp. J426]MCR5876718.1 class I SAM-dependent methyltransferase [Phenylobacterium sp. J426]
MFSDYPYVSGTTRTLTEHFKETAGRLSAAFGLGGEDLVVDIGSNDGTALKAYQALGLRVLGVEPATNVADLALEAGVPTLNRFFNEQTADLIRRDHGSAKLVTAAGVFFHLEELHSVCRGIKQLLAQDGVFSVQAIYLGGMVEKSAFDQIYHEHLCYYTLRSLQGLLAQHGLEVFDATVKPIHGGSLEAHIGHPGVREVSPRVEAMLAEEARAGLGELATYQAFAARVWRLRDDLLAALRDQAARGRRVYAYSAPAKGATLLNAFGIGPELVQCAVERAPLKFNHLIPGARIPIRNEAETDRPDAYLMLAWNFLDEFIVKEREFLSAGGEFIVPVPQVRVVGAEALAA